MEIVSDMIIKFTADDISDIYIPDIDIHQYEYEIITPLNGIVIHCRPVNRNQGGWCGMNVNTYIDIELTEEDVKKIIAEFINKKIRRHD